MPVQDPIRNDFYQEVKMTQFIQVLTATGTKDSAERIAKNLVEKRLAACVQVFGPIMSIYHWKGQIESAGEWLCLMKSRKNLFDDIIRTIREIHPYETPEIMSVPVLDGSEDYLAWLESELKEENHDTGR
jgi:periplasmic divalent cation tolerance protein